MSGNRQQARGRFITIEGIEGVGKTTHVNAVAEQIRAAGKEVVVTREPGGVPLAEKIRALLLSTEKPAPAPMTELLLMFSARAAHLDGLIWPALAAGRWVVCDRFTDASYAYQGAGRELGGEAVATLENLVQKDFRPDLTLLLDADWAVTRSRRAQRGISDRFELEDRQFFERARLAYLDRARREPARIKLIDAAADLAQVRTEISSRLAEFIFKNN